MLAPSVAFKLQAKSTALPTSAVSCKRSAAGLSSALWLWRRVLLSPFVQAWLSALGGMRNQKQNARLQHARGQMFICGMFGNCASSVLSPRTPPGIQDFGRKAAIVWAASDCDNLQQEQEHEEENNSNVEQERATSSVDSERYEGDDRVALRDDRHPAPCSPASSTATSEGDGTTSSASTSTSDRMECSANHIQDAPSEAGRFSVTSEVWDLRQTDLDELVAEVKPGNCTKRSLACLQKHVNDQEGGVIRTSDVAASLITLLLSSNLSAGTDTGSCDTSTSSESLDEEHQREEASRTFDDSLAALTVLSEDESTAQLMATPEMLSVVTWYLIKGTRDDARENACLLLEKLSLVENFKASMGGSPQVMAAIVALLRDEKHPKLAKLATKTLLALCLLRENRRRAVEAGVVAALLEMLPRARSATAEKALATLELLSTIEDGKVAVSEHALAIPILVELILKVSDRGTEYAAGTLSSICCDSSTMQETAVAMGAPTKLLLLIQSGCTTRAKRKASQLLKVLHKQWGEHPCNPDSGRTDAIHY